MKRAWITALVVALAMALCALPGMAFAEGGGGGGGGNGGGGGGGTGNGDGSGSGGGNAIPELLESLPADGATISASEAAEIWLNFTNNVTDASVVDGNIAKIHLQKDDGIGVAATMSTADTQIEPEKRTYIYIKPDQALEPGAYVIVAEQGITAKNGQSTEKEFRVSFTVKADEQASGSSAASSGSASSAAASTGSASGASASSGSSSSAASSGSAAKGDNKANNQGVSPIIWIVAIVVIVAIVAFVLFNRRKKAPTGDAPAKGADGTSTAKADDTPATSVDDAPAKGADDVAAKDAGDGASEANSDTKPE